MQDLQHNIKGDYLWEVGLDVIFLIFGFFFASLLATSLPPIKLYVKIAIILDFQQYHTLELVYVPSTCYLHDLENFRNLPNSQWNRDDGDDDDDDDDDDTQLIRLWRD